MWNIHNPHYVFLHSLISGNVTYLYFCKVHPAALATQALNDIPLVNEVRDVDTTLLVEFSLVDSMSKYLKILVHFL